MADVSHEEGKFSALARWVQRRPWIIFLVTTALLVVAVVPLTNMSMRSSTTDTVPASSEQAGALDILAEDYPALTLPEVQIVAEAAPEEMASYAAEIEQLDGVDFVNAPEPLDDGYASLSVNVATDDPGGQVATDVTEEIRDLDPGFPTWVGGQAGAQIDFNQSLADSFGWALGLITVTVLVLLFFMTGSVVIPIKALIINLTSIAASIGITEFLFTTEWSASLLGLDEPVGGLEVYVVAIIAAFGFGLAMDYEVFLLSRIKETWDSTGDNDLAVQRGLQRSGRIITAAAAIIVAVFLGFSFGELVPIKQVGIGLAIAVFLDATVVRMLLVPATMSILGRWNWWCPKFLRPVAQRMAISH